MPLDILDFFRGPHLTPEEHAEGEAQRARAWQAWQDVKAAVQRSLDAQAEARARRDQPSKEPRPSLFDVPGMLQRSIESFPREPRQAPKPGEPGYAPDTFYALDLPPDLRPPRSVQPPVFGGFFTDLIRAISAGGQAAEAAAQGVARDLVSERADP
jgi:hypothetical protein